MYVCMYVSNRMSGHRSINGLRFDFVAMRVQQVNNEQHYYTRKKTNVFRLNRSLHTLLLVKAVDGFQSFSNTIGHRSASFVWLRCCATMRT